MSILDYEKAAKIDTDLFAEAEAAYQENTIPEVNSDIQEAVDQVFSSTTQSYREVLLGCGRARILDRSVNIRYPYMNQSRDAFNGRTLGERVVNPFLQNRVLPCSKGPYLATFRRNVKFIPETEFGLRDKVGYRAFLNYIAARSKRQTKPKPVCSFSICFIALLCCGMRQISRFLELTD